MCTTSGYVTTAARSTRRPSARKGSRGVRNCRTSRSHPGGMGGPSACCHSRRRRRRPVAESQRGQTARLHRARPEHPRQPHHSGHRTQGNRFRQQSRRTTTGQRMGFFTASASTVRMYAVLRALMSYAEDSEIIARSPCRRIRLPQISPRVPKSLTPTASAALQMQWARRSDGLPRSIRSPMG